MGLSLALAKTSCIWYGDKWVLGVTRVILTLWGGVLDCDFPLEGMNLWLSESKDLVSWVGFRLGSLVLMLATIDRRVFVCRVFFVELVLVYLSLF